MVKTPYKKLRSSSNQEPLKCLYHPWSLDRNSCFIDDSGRKVCDTPASGGAVEGHDVQTSLMNYCNSEVSLGICLAAAVNCILGMTGVNYLKSKTRLRK